MQTLFGSATGDANLDYSVDLLDLSALATHFNQPATTYGEGDFNADGVVDLLDLSLLASHFGFVASVPEPGAGLVLLGMGLLVARRR